MSCEELSKTRRGQRPSPGRIAGLAMALAWVLPGGGTLIGAPQEPTRGGTEISTPVTLEVDPEPIPSLSDGNGVFEPGERVVVAPAWQNGDTEQQSLTGAAADFTGPAGPTYTLIDAFADYGVLGPGALASCRDSEDCYEMDIGPEGVARPATHWDTTFDETLSDGTTQRWTLHVGDSFLDVPRTNLFYLAIETLLHHGVSKEPLLAQRDLRVLGCTESEFCPSLPTTRAQAAVFVLMGLEDGDFTPEPCSAEQQRFVDVPAGSPFCPWIEELARRDITAGCGGDAFCPADSMTRAQMSVFLLKALHGPDFTPEPCTGAFTDVTCPSPFADWIEELFAAGITVGCRADPLAYCPAAPVTRGQKAAFVTRTFGLALYGPNAQNNPPVVERATFSLAENSADGTPVGTVAVTDPDAGQSHTLTITAGNTGGAFNLDASTGELTVANSAVLDFETTPTFELTVEATDDGVPPAVGSGTVTVTLTDVNEPPTAVGDTYETDEDTPLNIGAPGVLVNDDDVEGAALTAVLDTDVSNGSLTLNSDGSFGYTPDLDFNGVDSFSYHANDGTVDSNPATVTITVNPVNDPPMADDETVTAACNLEHVVETDPEESAEATGSVFRTVADNVLVGDSDPVEGTAIAIVQADGTTSDTTAPFDITTNEGGSLTLHADGSFVFTPEGGDRSVADSFTYNIQDAEGAQDTATVSLNVGAICVWLVDNSSSGADDSGTGTSSDPFTSLVDEIGPDALPDDAEDASIDGDVIYVFEGDSTSGDPYQGDFVTDANQKLLGQGVDLVVDFGSGDETLFTGDPANRPLIDDADGDAVQVTDVTGVEVAGFELAADDNALQVTSAGAPVGLDFHDNAISGSGSQAVLISQTVAGSSVVTLTGNTVAATGTAVEASTTAGTLELALDGNTGIRSTAGHAIHLDNSAGGGTLYVTSLAGNAVDGSSSGDGVRILGATFDAEPGGAIQPVDGGATTIGASGDPVSGAGLMLGGVSGELGYSDLQVFSGTIGVSLSDSPAAVFAFDGLQVVADAGAGLFADNGGSVTVADGAIAATGAAALDADATLIDVTLASLGAASSPTRGVRVSNGGASSLSVTGTTLITAAGEGVLLSGNAGGSFSFAELDVTTTAGAGLVANASGTLGVTDAGSAISALGGPALDVTDTALNANIGTLSSTGSPANGVRLLNATGTLTAAGGALIGSGGTAFQVNGGAVVFAFGGTVVYDGFDRVVDVANITGGSVTFGGQVTGGADSTGVRIDNADGDVSFARLDLGASGSPMTNTAVTLSGGSIGTFAFADTQIFTDGATAFSATDGGTVEITGGGNSISAANGVGLNLTNTGIGANGVTFESISAGGAANGIVLDSTGTAGEFVVTGNGGSCTATSPICTGGRLQFTSGADGAVAGSGVYLNDTGSVSLSFMRIDNHPNYAIFGDTVNGFSLIDSLVDGDNGDNDGIDEGSIRFIDLLGSGAITRCDISGGHEDNLRLVNETGTLDRLVITDSSFHDNSSAFGNDGILLESRSSAVLRITVDNSTFSAHRGDHFDGNATDSSTLDVIFTNNTMAGGHPNALGQTFILSNGASADVTFDVSGNGINGAILSAFTFFQSAASTASSSLTGTFDGNTIGTTGSAGSGSTQGHGAVINATGSGTVTVLADNNQLRQWSNEHGILVQAGDESPTVNVTVSNNTIEEPNTAAGSFPSNGLHLNAGTTSAGAASVCLDVQGNDMVGAGALGADDFRLRQRNSSTVNLPGYEDGSGDTVAVVAFVQANNTGDPTGVASVSGSGGGFTGTGTSCPTP